MFLCACVCARVFVENYLSCANACVRRRFLGQTLVALVSMFFIRTADHLARVCYALLAISIVYGVVVWLFFAASPDELERGIGFTSRILRSCCCLGRGRDGALATTTTISTTRQRRGGGTLTAPLLLLGMQSPPPPPPPRHADDAGRRVVDRENGGKGAGRSSTSESSAHSVVNFAAGSNDDDGGDDGGCDDDGQGDGDPVAESMRRQRQQEQQEQRPSPPPPPQQQRMSFCEGVKRFLDSVPCLLLVAVCALVNGMYNMWQSAFPMVLTNASGEAFAANQTPAHLEEYVHARRATFAHLYVCVLRRLHEQQQQQRQQ